jgi:hypothetical protein
MAQAGQILRSNPMTFASATGSELRYIHAAASCDLPWLLVSKVSESVQCSQVSEIVGLLNGADYLALE